MNNNLCNNCKTCLDRGIIREAQICLNCSVNAAVNYLDNKKKKPPKYSLEVFEDHAVIKGIIPTPIMLLLIRICNEEGFNKVTSPDDGSKGFKFIKGN
jgi:hypothetical protein